MSWVDWLKGFAERHPDGETESAERPAPAVHTPRRAGESYAQEWMRVLEDAGPGRDPFNTYTWELKPEAPTPKDPAPQEAVQKETAPTETPPKSKAADPAPAKQHTVDTYTWKVHEKNSREDPWGLKDSSSVESAPRKDGVNPYDTGVFDASWTGRFDKR